MKKTEVLIFKFGDMGGAIASLPHFTGGCVYPFARMVGSKLRDREFLLEMSFCVFFVFTPKPHLIFAQPLTTKPFEYVADPLHWR